MFLANTGKRLPNGNQILARIMSHSKISFRGKKMFKDVRVQMTLRKKKKLMCCFCDEILLAEAVVPL